MPSSPGSTIAEKVFAWWDYFLYIPLTALRVGTIIYFLFYWFSCNDSGPYTFSFAVLTFILLTYIAIDQLRWCALPLMKRPRPVAPRAGWTVGVATTFVPGVESIEMLKKQTFKTLVNLHYPHDTWVLDEGDDHQVKILCLKLGAHHFSRKNLPRYQTDSDLFQIGTKHGNYNAWLYEIGFHWYDIITAFDPDHVPHASFLTHVLGYFEDPKVAYVQVAQAYYNQNASLIARGAAESLWILFFHPDGKLWYGTADCHRLSQYAPHFRPETGEWICTSRCGRSADHPALIRAKAGKGCIFRASSQKVLTPVDWNGYLTQQRRWAR